MELKWSYVLLIVVLLGCGSCLDWQGAGNWTSDNLTVLHNEINGVDPTEQYYMLSTDASRISNDLNALWDPAWNVVIVYYTDGNNYDSVMYGYGFREHWFWFNGWKRADGTYLSFIIWKDYNCVGWVTYGGGVATSSYSTSITNAIQNAVLGGVINRKTSDIWKVAQSIQSVIPSADSTILQDPLGYTIIASQAGHLSFFG